MLIKGKRLLTKDIIAVRNPSNNDVLFEMPVGSEEDVELAINAAKEGAAVARGMSRYQRATILQRAAALVSEASEEFAQTIVQEAGKTIRQARKEVGRCCNTLTLSAEEAKRFGGETIPFYSVEGSENRHGYFTREPVGIVLAITPFNDPLNLVAHKIGPAIAAGNSIILKPSDKAPISAFKLVEAFLEAGLPTEMISIVTGQAETAATLVARDEIRMISFTGGKFAAEKITQSAGIKRISMDLGGNAPVIVCADCNLDHAVESCVSGSFWASGQNCIGVQRIFVEQGIYQRFLEEFEKMTTQLILGDPADEATDVGPMISAQEAKRIQSWVDEALLLGARLITGHELNGAFYSPTVLTGVPDQAKVVCEEVFAPVVVIEPFCDFSSVLTRANEPDFLLHAGIFTSNLSKAHKAISVLNVGGVMINDSSDYRLDAMPFGGSKHGNMGREGVRFAVEEMSQPKVVCFLDLGDSHQRELT